MGSSAHVTSIETLRNFAAALTKFQADANDAVEMLKLQARRAENWLQQDRTRYWPTEARRASERLAEARNELSRKKIEKGEDASASLIEYKKAVENAKRRMRLCEDKIRSVKHWIRVISQEMNAYEGQMTRMGEVVETEIPRAIAAIKRMAASLEKYVELESPVAQSPPAQPAPTDSPATDQ